MLLVHWPFLILFFAGLGLGVYAMLQGVEKPPAEKVVQTRVGLLPAVLLPYVSSARLFYPSLAAFMAAFGAAGYLLVRYTSLPLWAAIAIATVLGGLAIWGALSLVAQWAVPSARREVVDERYVLQGQFAHVSRAIAEHEKGEIRFEFDGTAYAMEAVSLDGQPASLGAEVVIERVEDGVAYVEAWATVERRI